MEYGGRMLDTCKGWVACLLCACLLTGCGTPQSGPNNAPETEPMNVIDTTDNGEDTLLYEEETAERDTVPTRDTLAIEETTDEADGTSTETSTTRWTETTRGTYWSETVDDTDAARESVTEEDTALRLCGCTVDEIILYFHEVVHSSEYSFGSGHADQVHRWEQPIYYQLHGDYTIEDMEVLRTICCQLNEVEGFPGMYASPDEASKNLDIYFYGESQMREEFGYLINYEAADGMMTYWYSNATSEILNAVICCRSDVGQTLRNSVIVEEVVNMLGMPNDTRTRHDSILYQYGSSATEPSELDWLLIRLLYDERMYCGYDCEATAEVIRRLFPEWV